MKVAIYSRKSVFTGKGESIENQIEMCRKYFLNLYPKEVEFLIYEDEGFSGGNINRPEFKKMLKDIKANKFNVLVCYRLDRISRNVSDFSALLELLQNHNIDFISITEHFDTSTPMGRAMVYISSVFAQLERETIAERIRDNMLELSKQGRWLGGQMPLGFTSEKVIYMDTELKERSFYRLSPIENELNLVKVIFSKYLKYNSISMVINYLSSIEAKGKNGASFSSVSVNDILRNPVYVMSDENVKQHLIKKGLQFWGKPNGNGILIYNKRTSKYKNKKISEWIASPSNHNGIIKSETWLKVQHSLDKNSKSTRLGTSKKALLSGVLKCAKCGSTMRVSYGRTRKDGTRTHYYICSNKAHSLGVNCNNPNANGPLLEKAVLEKILIYDSDLLKKNLLLSLSNTKENSTLTLSIDNLNKEINNLLNQLSKTTNENVQNLILEKVESLSNKANKLKDSLIPSNTYKNFDIDSVIEKFSNIDNLYSFISTSENMDLHLYFRNMICRLVKEVIFDGSNNSVYVDV